MAEQLKPPPAIKPDVWEKTLSQYNTTMTRIEEGREKLNAEASEAREGLKSMGISVAAANAARAYSKATGKQRTNFDSTYQIARRTVGEPIQGVLFKDPTAPEEGIGEEPGTPSDDKPSDGSITDPEEIGKALTKKTERQPEAVH